MNAEPVMIEEGEEAYAEGAGQRLPASFYGNLMDVLMPAKPPEPKNARVVRQFDIETVKPDTRPMPEVVPAPKPRAERRSREEARAFRNRSLRAAAGLD